MTLGALGYVGYGVETTEGTTVAPTIFLPVSSFSFEDTNEYITPEQVRGTRDRYVLMPSPYMTSGSMDMELVPNGIAPLLRSAFSAGGAGITSSAYGGGGYQHVIVPGSTSPTFTFESSAADILVMRYGGIRVNTLEIAAAFGELVTASWGLEGTTRVKELTPATESYADVEPFSFTGASVKVAGSDIANVKSFNFSVGNNLDRIGTLRKTRSWKRTAFGMRDLGLSMTMDFTDTADYDLFLAETEFSVMLHLEGQSGLSGMGTNKPALVLSFPRVRWGAVGVPITTTDYIEQSVTATIMRPISSGNAVDVTLVNNEATVAGA
jgi:Phage tail tube protein